MKTTHLLVTLIAAAACSSSHPIAKSSSRLEIIGQSVLAEGTRFNDTLVGGLSGLVYDATTNEITAVSDDPGMEASRGPGRFYTFTIETKANAVVVNPKRLTRVTGFRVGATDLEAIAPFGKGWLLSLESETDQMNKFRAGDRSATSRPRLLRTDAKGKVFREYMLPERFQPSGDVAHGVVLNSGIEGLSAVNDDFAGAQWAIISEAPLEQDRATNPLANRLTLFSLSDKSPATWSDRVEYVYPFSPVPTKVGFSPTTVDRGVSDLLYVGNGKFWVLERSYFNNKEQKRTRNVVEIYEVDLAHTKAEVTGGADKLAGQAVLEKSLVANFDDFVPQMAPVGENIGSIIDNVEGLTFGPKVDGKTTVISVTDDNFGKSQRTIFMVFKVLQRP